MTSFAFAAACTPGPNNIMLAASGVNFGFARTLPHMAGIVVGFTVLMAACAAGVGGLLTTYPVVHTAMKVAGAAYLLWLAWKIANAGQPAAGPAAGNPLTFLQAAGFQWVNPKGVLVAAGAAALFVRPGTALADTVAMLAVFSFATLVSVVLWTLVGRAASRALRDARRARMFNVAMAALLVASIVPMVFD